MDYKQFVREVLTVIALLLGLAVFNTAIIGFAPAIMPYEWVLQYLSYFTWIGRLLLAIILFMLIRHDNKTKISVSLLS